MATPTVSEALTITGGNEFGRISRRTIRRSFAPSARAAATNSRSRRLRNSARTSRAVPAQFDTPMAATTVQIDGEKIATRTMAKRKAGSTWKNSVIRIRTSSIGPPA